MLIKHICRTKKKKKSSVISRSFSTAISTALSDNINI